MPTLELIRKAIQTGDQKINLSAATSLAYDNVGTTPYLLFCSINANGVPSILGNQNGAVADTGLALFAGTKDGNTSGDMRFDVRENDNSAYATTANKAYRWSVNGSEMAYMTRLGGWQFAPSGGIAGTTAVFNTADSQYGIQIKTSTTAGQRPFLGLFGAQTSDASVANIEFVNQSPGAATIAQIYASRSGANNSGSLNFETRNAGVGVLAATASPAGLWVVGPSTGGPANAYSHTLTGHIKLSQAGTGNAGSGISGKTYSVSNGGTAVIAPDSAAGFLFIMEPDNARMACYSINSGHFTTTLHFSTGGVWGTSAGASSHNVYFSSDYIIQNNSGSARTYSVLFISGFPTSGTLV